MQHVSSFTTVSPAARKVAALAAYDAAMHNPAGADWQSVAHMLRAVLPAGKAKAEPSDADPAWFADYALPKVYQQDSLVVTFTDGVTVRCNVHTAPRKPARVAKACRVAIAFYRARTAHGAGCSVPAFANLANATTGESYDAAECSRLTAALRAVQVDAVAPVRTVTVASVERMAAQLVRRRAGLAKAVDLEIAIRGIPTSERRRHKAVTAYSLHGSADTWRAALNGARIELARMRAALSPSDPTPTDRAPVPAAPVADAPAALIPAATIVTADLNMVADAMPLCPAVMQPCRAACPFRSGCCKPVPVDADADSAALWCEAVASAYADAAPFELAGTFEDASELATAPVEPLAPVPPCDPAPAASAPVCAALVEPASAPDLPASAPDASPLASHTVTAVCLSERARDALFERILDGTFPARGVSGRGGAWSVTVQDARDCADIPSVRWVGLPRKPYTRRAEAAVSLAVAA